MLAKLPRLDRAPAWFQIAVGVLLGGLLGAFQGQLANDDWFSPLIVYGGLAWGTFRALYLLVEYRKRRSLAAKAGPAKDLRAPE